MLSCQFLLRTRSIFIIDKKLSASMIALCFMCSNGSKLIEMPGNEVETTTTEPTATTEPTTQTTLTTSFTTTIFSSTLDSLTVTTLRATESSNDQL